MKENGFSDTPEKYVSSIGSTNWPPEMASFERKKGFYPEVIESSNYFNNLLSEFANLPFEEATRISARAIINQNTLGKIIDNPNKYIIETLIPLNGCGIPQLEDCVLVYLGKNHLSRTPPSYIVKQQLDLAKQIFNNQSQQQRQKIHDNQFSITLFDSNNLTPEVFQQYCHLYSIFSWGPHEIKEMLTASSNIIIYAQKKDSGQIVSSVLAEKGTITIERDGQSINLSLVEITEAATLPSFRGNGLYQTVSDTLLDYLSQLSSPPNLVFGELNLNSPGVLKVAARQNRTPAFYTAEEFGLPHAWFLPQHVTINQGSQTDNQRPENYRYNNLMIAFLNQNSLLKRLKSPLLRIYGEKTDH